MEEDNDLKTELENLGKEMRELGSTFLMGIDTALSDVNKNHEVTSKHIVQIHENTLETWGETYESKEILLDTNENIKSLVAFFKGQRLEEYERDREQKVRDEKMLEALKGGGVGVPDSVSSASELDTSGKGLGILGRLGASIAGLGRGLASVGIMAPKVIAGAGAIGASIALIGAGIAGAAWLTGRALPTFVDGIRSFEEVDGEKVKSAGEALKALGIGFAAWGVGQTASGIGNVFSAVSSLFGGDSQADLIEQMQRFGEAKIDTESVKNNAEALTAFGVAMAAGGAGSSFAAIGTLASGLANGITSLFRQESDPLSQLKKFGEEKVDLDAVKNNAEAMIAFGGAMSVGSVSVATEGLGTLISGITGGIGELFRPGAASPIDQMKKFSEERVDLDTVKNNAEAMIAFATATAVGGVGVATEGLGTLVSGITGGIGELFRPGAANPLDQLKKFGEERVDLDTVKNNAEAMVAFSRAMPLGAGAIATEGLGTFVSGLVGGFGELFRPGGASPIDQLKKFGEVRVDAGNVKNNAEAMEAFARAMSITEGTVSTSGMETLVSGITGSIGQFFGRGGADPLSQLKEFGETDINADAVLNNAMAMESFSRVMSSRVDMSVAKKTIEDFSSIINKLFQDDSFDQLYEFGERRINADNVMNNIGAIQSFAEVSSIEPVRVSNELIQRQREQEMFREASEASIQQQGVTPVVSTVNVSQDSYSSIVTPQHSPNARAESMEDVYYSGGFSTSSFL